MEKWEETGSHISAWAFLLLPSSHKHSARQAQTHRSSIPFSANSLTKPKRCHQRMSQASRRCSYILANKMCGETYVQLDLDKGAEGVGTLGLQLDTKRPSRVRQLCHPQGLANIPVQILRVLAVSSSFGQLDQQGMMQAIVQSSFAQFLHNGAAQQPPSPFANEHLDQARLVRLECHSRSNCLALQTLSPAHHLGNHGPATKQKNQGLNQV